VVETTKGLIDVEVFDDGILEELVALPGATVAVGAVLARIASESAAAPTSSAATPGPSSVPPTAPGAEAAAPSVQVSLAKEGTPSPTAAPPRRRISPAARRRAQELGIDLASVAGSGPERVVRIEDVERLGTPAPPVPQRAAMRATIGAAMARSKREIPHYYLAHTVDFGAARDWLAQFNASVPVAERLIEAVLLVKAVARAVSEIEGFNGSFHEGQFHRSESVHVGAAIAMRDLVTRVRGGRMRSSELNSATITVTSLGAEAVDVLFPVINPPQVAIIGAGAIGMRPWVSDGTLAVRPLLTLTLAADHRVTDGRAGSRLLRRIAELLAGPATL
jgi:pyruvate dehydrogenase E2 component (dihydrolipoamide acetyltransferase)